MRLFLVLLLLGCEQVPTDGPDAQGYSWVKDGPSAPVQLHVGVDVFLNCGQSEKALSCSIQGRGDGLCHVYLPPDPKPWQEAHERRHCDGWRHPNPLRI